MQSVIHVNRPEAKLFGPTRPEGSQQCRGIDATAERHEHPYSGKTRQQVNQTGQEPLRIEHYFPRLLLLRFFGEYPER